MNDFCAAYHDFYQACRDGNLENVASIVSRINSLDELNDGFIDACIHGHLEIVNFLIASGANNWSCGLASACGNGHLKIVQLMINKGAKTFAEGLENACSGGYLEIVRLMIDCGALNFNHGFIYACGNGHLEIVNLMISKGANDWNEGLYRAYLGDHNDVQKLMISKGADRVIWYMSWPRDKPEIENLLYFGAPMSMFRDVINYQQFENYLVDVKKSILNAGRKVRTNSDSTSSLNTNQTVLLPDLLNIISQFIII